jgi:DnaJ domain
VTDAYPLKWPPGWARLSESQRKPAAFNVGGNSQQRKLEINDAVKRLYAELHAFGVKDESIVISTMLRPRLGGEPVQGKDTDPGVAVYWERKGSRQCMAIDRYTRVADNLAAVAATLNAMRAIDRHGGATILDRAFTGFTALTGPSEPWTLLGVDRLAGATEIKDAYRRKASVHHPDKGGDPETFKRLTEARDAMLEGRR